ncbi:hypothetical protein N7532_004711 [Penicillium argentinense]|uniref:Uncharacterized protein n=1 Tax=Penicillium argentinense TaxID=1131581 RepID=A0A9W9FQG0_9EURO|nr:uncharacterized protein N7532_004711 [Penicillium argentinense]KAJ5104182.1 hypothetical protein N7532_004711 [Penicillium argentinense]
MLSKSLLLWPAVALASVTVEDPSDVIDPSLWAADNAIIPDYDIAMVLSQPSDILATRNVKGKTASADHVTWYATANDTSVLLVADKGSFTGSYMTFDKSGYSTNLNDATCTKANASTASFDHVNVTVHNGAAGFYSYGTGTVVNVTNSWLYSSGPVSHGLYASGNGTIYASNLEVYSGGMRSSSFSGDSPGGYIYVKDSVASAAGIGSATFYALGSIYAQNVVSVSEKGPVVFSDGAQSTTLVNCECTAGLLGGVAMFSSSTRSSGATLNLTNTKFTTTGSTMPGLWFGNLVGKVTLNNTELNTASGILVVANYSQITQDFDYYASYSDNNSLRPAEVTVSVSESSLSGDLVAYNGSYIGWTLADYSSWTGAAYSGYKDATFDVALDSTSNWTLTADTTVRNFTDTLSTLKNIQSQGFTLYYNATVSTWLDGKTIRLRGGGVARPASSISSRVRHKARSWRV